MLPGPKSRPEIEPIDLKHKSIGSFSRCFFYLQANIHKEKSTVMKRLSIHIFSVDGCDKDGDFFVDQCAICMDGKTGDLSQYTHYWKMPQCLDVCIDYYDVNLDINELIKRFGSNAGFVGENEAVFDLRQGASIHLQEVFWLHLDLI